MPSLEEQVAALQVENAGLKAELAFLKQHPVFLAGLKGENLVCDLMNGKLTDFAEKFDVTAGKYKIEVKYSNLGIPYRNAITKRWSWSKPLGWKDKGKIYDFLVLVGEKDHRFPNQYIDARRLAWFVRRHMPLFSLFVHCDTVGRYSTQCDASSPYEAIRGFLRKGSLKQFLAPHAEWPKEFTMRDIYAFTPLDGLANLYFCGLGRRGKYVQIHLVQTARRSSTGERYCGPRRKHVTLRQ